MSASEHEQRSSQGEDATPEQPAQGGEPAEPPVLDETLPADRAGWEAWADASGDGRTNGEEEGQPQE